MPLRRRILITIPAPAPVSSSTPNNNQIVTTRKVNVMYTEIGVRQLPWDVLARRAVMVRVVLRDGGAFVCGGGAEPALLGTHSDSLPGTLALLSGCSRGHRMK